MQKEKGVENSTTNHTLFLKSLNVARASPPPKLSAEDLERRGARAHAAWTHPKKVKLLFGPC